MYFNTGLYGKKSSPWGGCFILVVLGMMAIVGAIYGCFHP